MDVHVPVVVDDVQQAPQTGGVQHQQVRHRQEGEVQTGGGGDHGAPHHHRDGQQVRDCAQGDLSGAAVQTQRQGVLVVGELLQNVLQARAWGRRRQSPPFRQRGVVCGVAGTPG